MLLTVIDPLAGFLLLLFFSFLLAVITALLSVGTVSLFFRSLRKQFTTTVYYSTMWSCVPTVIMSGHNTLGPYRWISSTLKWLQPERDLYKFQPVEFIILWLFISACVMYLKLRKT